MKDDLSKSIQFVKGVGEARSKVLSKVGINTVEDMLYYFPRGYEDRAVLKKIAELDSTKSDCFRAIIKNGVTEMRVRRGLSIQKLVVADETGSIVLTWFNQSYLKNTFKTGEEYVFFGKINSKSKRLEMSSPSYEKYSENLKSMGKIVPIYPLTANISQNVIRSVIKNCVDSTCGNIEEFMPEDIRKRNNLADINYAISNIHFPKDIDSFKYSRYRLVFEELLLLQLGLMSIKNQVTTDSKGIKFDKVDISEFISGLPFELTNAQKRVWSEIESDMLTDRPMNRLVQGDVGSGKTIVAGVGMFYAVKNGYQASIMAPTGILAVQHYEGFVKLFEKYGFNVVLLTSGLPAKQKREVLEKIKSGEANIIVGTHALLEDDVEFKNLGYVITDEQHRFGVRQRALLTAKGDMPDVLVMTATPIPRTLALILYGDLDISVIDELPPGRKKIETYAVDEGMRARINAFVENHVNQGRQIYIVCPLVEESEVVDAKSVEAHVQDVKSYFNKYRVEYLYGKMKPKDKDDIMERFRNGDVDILVSTTVIEVGVNVPNATIMIIENADKFGLAQLHQLRGRVGRGSEQSFCVLMCDFKTKIARERMKIMEKSNNGFEIAEKDLELRGPGEFFGTRQHGIPDLKIANLFTDMDILKDAQIEAKHIFEVDRKLELPEYIGIKEKVIERFKDRAQDITMN